MADSPLTLPELITINDRNLQDVDIPNFLSSSPFMRTNAATVASHDTLHKYLVYQNPTVGFRQVNDGREMDASVDSWVQTTCEILDGSFHVDQSLAESYRLGGAAGLVNREAGRSLDACFFTAEIQMFNGRAVASAEGTNPDNPADTTTYVGTPGTGLGDANGFNGFPNWNVLGAADGDMVVDAGGTTADAQTSIYLLRSGESDVQIVTGRSGDINVGSTVVMERAGTTGTYPTLYTPISCWYALKIGSFVSSVARIANCDVTAQSGAGAINDDLLFTAIAKFGAGREPTHIYMSRAAREALRKSRTATNSDGAPAPLPTSVGGVPIIVTDGIFNTEAVLA